ncbi:retropepsin-like domain-containing protein, partial [Candidatus Gottesmanbacteria bacterium]|nr:retropepsin-like domain-containing protein [Candidatus Gottesmanbacteria bacterium]
EGQFFPVIPLRFYLEKKIIDSSALVDSGATISIFRVDIAKDLGLQVEKGKEIYLGGVGGRIKGYVHRLNVEVANKRFICPIVFSYEYLISLNLLGREEFFKRFRIVFEEKKNFLKLE